MELAIWEAEQRQKELIKTYGPRVRKAIDIRKSKTQDFRHYNRGHLASIWFSRKAKNETRSHRRKTKQSLQSGNGFLSFDKELGGDYQVATYEAS